MLTQVSFSSAPQILTQQREFLSQTPSDNEPDKQFYCKVDLGAIDFLALQTLPSIGSSTANTYLPIGNNALIDLAGNSYISRPRAS